MGNIVGFASTVRRRIRSSLTLVPILTALFISASASATDDYPLAEFEERVNAALQAAESALDQEDARLDELAVRNSGKLLPDGRRSLGQVTAEIRLLNRKIVELRAEERGFREKMDDVLKGLDSDIAKLAQHLSALQPASAEQPGETEQDESERTRTTENLFRDCPYCPEMVAIESGQFNMGSPPTERGRLDNESPVHSVTIGYRFAVGVHEVTRGEFDRFVSATNRAMGQSCWAWDGKWSERPQTGWRDPGFPQDDDHPVTCVSWNDAKAYVRWLSEQTGKQFRLLSESEWEYAARAGTATALYWGTDSSAQCRYANGADASTDYPQSVSCNDGHLHTSPAGSYDANGFGLHDLLGNVFEWVEDCWNDSYRSAPSDGSAWENGDCDQRVFRGGAWLNKPQFLRSAFRVKYAPRYRSNILGFRVARTLTEHDAGQPEPNAAAVEASLGLDRAARSSVQRGLSALGFEPGPVDGLFGRRTRAAIRAWQKAEGEEETGYLTGKQADSLIAVGEDQQEQQRVAREKAEREKAEHEARMIEEKKKIEQERLRPGREFRDCDICPQMVVVPAGTFMMGSPASEEDRDDNEGPVHRVTIPQPFAVGRYEVTVGEYANFADSTGHTSADGCQIYVHRKTNNWFKSDTHSWQDPGFVQGEDDPVVCVSWEDAQTFVRWLSVETGEEYRLLTESEWEYAARAGTTTPFHYGSTISTDQANYNGNLTYGNGRKGVYRKRTVPVGSFPANEFGLHNFHGNASEWVEDCYGKYDDVPRDGNTRVSGGDCGAGVVRGGNWLFGPRGLRSATRSWGYVGYRASVVGFRVARTLVP